MAGTSLLKNFVIKLELEYAQTHTQMSQIIVSFFSAELSTN